MWHGGYGEVGDLVGLGEEECETEWGRGVERVRGLDLVQKVEQGVSLVVVASVGEQVGQGLRGHMGKMLLDKAKKVVTWAKEIEFY